MAPHRHPGSPSSSTFEWTTRERILGELLSHGVQVPDLDPSARFVAIARLTADYRPLARAFQGLDGALRWLQQTESQHAAVDVIVDLSAPSLETSVIRPFHVLTTDDTREPLDLGSEALSPQAALASVRPPTHTSPLRRRAGAPRVIE
ncbi:MAG TPA: hypothetical protein VGI67_00570 [Thermoleophilaceae bacterium]